MDDTIYLLAFGTFGNPNGFRQSSFVGGNKNIFTSIKTFDLNTNAIKLFPNNQLFSVRKEIVNGFNAISYSKYSFAKEQNSDRGGTFIGSSLLFINEIPDENIIISKLNEFQDKLIEKNTKDDIILVDHSDKLTGELPKDFDKLKFNLKNFDELTNFDQNNKFLLVFCETKPHNLTKFYKKALLLLNKYDCIYFTSNEEIAKFVNDKDIYKLIQQVGNKNELDQEIQEIQNERKQIILNKIAEFEKEKLKLKEAQTKSFTEFETQIKENEKKQAENQKKIEESKVNLTSQNSIYQNQIKKIDDLINTLKSNEKLDKTDQSYQNIKSEFAADLRKIENPSSIQSITNPRIQNKNISPQNNNISDFTNNYRQKERQKKLDITKIISFILNILLIASILFIIFFPFWKKEEPIVSPENNNYVQPEDQDSLNTKLNPYPNDNLNLTNKQKTIDTLQNNTKIKTVVEIVFNKNPKSIWNIYGFQKEDYAKLLFEKNLTAFEIANNDTILTKKDSLKIFPSMKMEK